MKEKIKEILNKNKNNKLYVFFKVLLSLAFSIVLVLDKLLIFNGDVYSKFSDVCFKTFEVKNFLLILLLWVVTFLVITIIEYISDYIENTVYSKNNNKNGGIRVFLIAIAVILICWLPFVLSYFPGGIYADTTRSIAQAIGEENLNNHNPVIYALILKAFIKIGGFINSANAVQVGIKLFTIFQVLVMAGVCAYFVYWIHKNRVSTKYLVLTTLFFAFFNLIPLYAISIWKDTPFCIALFLYSIFLASTVFEDGKNLEKPIGILKYAILIFMVAFFRNNGMYIAILTTIILFIVYRKSLLKGLKGFMAVSLIELMICVIIQGPVYNHFKMNTEFVENLGVLIQQVCYVVSNDGNITDEELEFINNICPIEKIKEKYCPCLVDTIKWSGEFSDEFLEKNKGEFLKVWFKIFLKNPKDYIKAYLLNTIGYWDVNQATHDRYINPEMWGGSGESMGVIQKDYVQLKTNKSIRKIITPQIYISSAVFLFILLLGMLITIYKKKYKNLIAYVPAVLTWITIMIAVPLAFSLRYVYISVLMVPMSLVLPFLGKKEREDK